MNKQNIFSKPSTETVQDIDLRQVLFLFDIDGTMTDTTALDDRCFIESLEELYGFDLSDINWSTFEHVTDTGLADGIYKQNKGRSISKTELNKIQRLFFKKLSAAVIENPSSMLPVDGIIEFQDDLRDKRIPMAIATGGWRKSAEQKLNVAQILYEPFTLATCNDSFKRRTIINVAIARAQFEYQKKFSKVVYFGDGIWDARICEAMDIPMVGIDYHNTGQLEQTKIKHVFQDFINSSAIYQAVLQLIV